MNRRFFLGGALLAPAIPHALSKAPAPPVAPVAIPPPVIPPAPKEQTFPAWLEILSREDGRLLAIERMQVRKLESSTYSWFGAVGRQQFAFDGLRGLVDARLKIDLPSCPLVIRVGAAVLCEGATLNICFGDEILSID